jgi:hypothetical protein
MSFRPGVKFHNNGSCGYILSHKTAATAALVDVVLLLFFFLLQITPNPYAGYISTQETSIRTFVCCFNSPSIRYGDENSAS